MISVFFVMRLLKRVTTYFISVNIKKEFGEQFEEFWMSITKQNVCLSLKDITVCIIETNTSLLNYLIVPGNYFIWNSRKQNNFPTFYLFTSLIKTKFKTEHYVAAKNNAYKKFDSKWGFLRNYFRTEGD